MKIRMIKNGQEHLVHERDKELLLSVGWQLVEKEQAGEEIIRLKPAVKTKATVRALEEAKDNKGDE